MSHVKENRPVLSCIEENGILRYMAMSTTLGIFMPHRKAAQNRQPSVWPLEL